MRELEGAQKEGVCNWQWETRIGPTLVSYCRPIRNSNINHLNAKLNPISPLLAVLGAHPILHVSRIRVNVVSMHDTKTYWGVEVLFCAFLT